MNWEDALSMAAQGKVNLVVYGTRRELVFWRVVHFLQRWLLCPNGAHGFGMVNDRRCVFCQTWSLYFVRPPGPPPECPVVLSDAFFKLHEHTIYGPLPTTFVARGPSADC